MDFQFEYYILYNPKLKPKPFRYNLLKLGSASCNITFGRPMSRMIKSTFSIDDRHRPWSNLYISNFRTWSSGTMVVFRFWLLIFFRVIGTCSGWPFDSFSRRLHNPVAGYVIFTWTKFHSYNSSSDVLWLILGDLLTHD